MQRAILFGLGKDFRENLEYIKKHYYIIAYSDNKTIPLNCKEKYIVPYEIPKIQFDVLIICTNLYFFDIKKQLIKIDKDLENKIISLQQIYEGKLKKCECCENEVRYLPLPDMYNTMLHKYGYKGGIGEFINYEEYYCPLCQITDRGRLIVALLRKYHLQNKEERVLQIAPEKVIGTWIKENCPQCVYETTDLNMPDVTFNCDIQKMNMISDNYYDLIICSHVFEHVKNDLCAMKELNSVC